MAVENKEALEVRVIPRCHVYPSPLPHVTSHCLVSLAAATCQETQEALDGAIATLEEKVERRFNLNDSSSDDDEEEEDDKPVTPAPTTPAPTISTWLPLPWSREAPTVIDEG